MSLDIVPFRRRDLTVEISPEYIALRDEAVGMAALITRVDSPESNETAAAAAKECGELRRLAARAHKEAKAPIIKCGRDLDAKLDEATAALSAEESRLAHLTGDYVAGIEAQRRAALAAAEAAARAEENKLQEALSKTADIDEQQRIREAAAFAAQQRGQELAPMPTRAAGQSLREEWTIEIINAHELCAWAAKTGMVSCLKIEIRKTEMVAILDRGIVVPGLNAKKEHVVRQR